MKKKNKLTSTTSPLTPILVVDIKTGEIVTDWSQPVRELLSFVRTETEQISRSPINTISLVEAWSGSPKANVFAERAGIKLQSTLPSTVLAKSRVERLVRDKLITELSSWVKSPNRLKGYPTFWEKINLGAVDRQMVTLGVEGASLTLLWKVWDRELLFEFELPTYLFSRRRVTKWCLPTVQTSKKTGNIIFLFAFEETIKPRKPSKRKAGIDIGQVEPFTLAILNEKGVRSAHYTSSKGLKNLSLKRSRLLIEKKQVKAKLTQYEKLGWNPLQQEKLTVNLAHLTRKIRTLGVEVAHLTGYEVAQKVRNHALHEVNIEDLRFAQGAKYGGRWNHSATQDAITHALAREGVQTKRVNARNTSQECHKCGSRITHSNRSIHCTQCKHYLNRDFNAAMNIAARSTINRSESQRALGGSPTHKREATLDSTPAISVTRSHLLMIRTTT